MKSYNNLWEKFISEENLQLAKKNALKGKSTRPSIIKKLEDPDFDSKIMEYAKHFKNARHTPKEIYDGIQRKKRTIIVPTFEEQVVHHMVVNILKPIFQKPMYFHSYGSLPDKGAHKGKKAIEKYIRNHPKDCKYILKMDIRKYFDSIPHDICLAKLRKIIKDERFHAVLVEIISVIDKGIPLGFYTSQWIANWYLTDLDHYIKQDLKAKFYVRYMDDMVIFGSNKKRLHEMRKSVENYLSSNLGLHLKDNYQVFKFDYNGKFRCLDFMGFKFYRNRTILRRSIMLKASRKAKKIKEKKNIYTVRQMLAYLGWLSATNTYGFYVKYIKPYVNFGKLKKYVSKYDLRKGEGYGMDKIALNGAA